MKKILFALIILLSALIFQPAFAAPQAFSKSVPVEAVTNFDSENPVETIDVKILDERELADETVLKEGDNVHFEVLEVKEPKRLKQNANFKLQAKYYIDAKGQKYEFKHDTFARYTTIVDKKDVAKSAALGVGSYFVKGLSVGVAAVEGAVKNEEGNRAKSSVVSVYKASPFSYVEKGQPLKLSQGDSFLLKFNIPDFEDEEEEEPNYEYELPENDAEVTSRSSNAGTE